MKALRLFHWVNVGPNQVLDQSGLHCFGIGEVDDADGDGGCFGHLRGAVTPRSGYDLKGLPGGWPDKQGRQYALGADALCLMFRKRLCGRCGGKPHGCWRCAF
jgi:hypothetical protein